MTHELNVTSYAILGLLAMRDWSAYDLTQEMQRNLAYFWPRAESAIYVEAKRLRASGYATARVELHGRRRRTIYAITPQGRAALRAWLAEPAGRGVQIESESLLRVFLAGALPPDPDAVFGALGAIERETAELIAKSLVVGGEFLDGVHPFQEQLPWRAHTHAFFARYAVLVAEWVQETRAQVAAWEERSESERLEAARALVVDARRKLQAAPLPPDLATEEEQAADG